MAKAPFWYQQLQAVVRKSKKSKSMAQIFTWLNIQGKNIWLWCFLGLVLLLVWNWQLLLATFAGIGLMLSVYFLQDYNWRRCFASWQRFLSGSNRQLTVAVGSGGMAALGTYLAASIWVNAENRWLAVGTIVQGFATIITLILVLWQSIICKSKPEEAKLEQLLSELTDVKPLKRLVAVHKLSRLLENSRLSKSYRQQLLACFRLMLSGETEPTIREAILDILQMWDREEQVPQVRQPRKIPIDLPQYAHRLQQTQ